MKRFRFIENGLCCDVFYNENKNINKNALFLYGFPTNIGANNLTELLIDHGYTVLQPHYFGTYDSNGDFTPQAAFQTVKTITEIVKNSKVLNLKNDAVYELPNKISICIGYSFGAYVLRHTIQYLEQVENVMLFSPVLSNNPKNILCWVNESGLKHLDYVIKTRPFTYRINNKEKWVQEYVNDEFKEVECTGNVNNVLWIYGKKDSAIIETKLQEKFAYATKVCINSMARAYLHCVANGEHGINTLINDETIPIIEPFL